MRAGSMIELQTLLQYTEVDDLKSRLQDHENLTKCDTSGNTALHIAARYGDLRAIKKIIKEYHKAKLSLDIQNKLEETPLMLAVKHNRIEIANELLGLSPHAQYMPYTKYADVNKTAHGCTAYDTAVLADHGEMIELLKNARHSKPKGDYLHEITQPFSKRSQKVIQNTYQLELQQLHHKQRRSAWENVAYGIFCPTAAVLTMELPGIEPFVDWLNQTFASYHAHIGLLALGPGTMMFLGLGVTLGFLLLWSNYQIAEAEYGKASHETYHLKTLQERYRNKKSEILASARNTLADKGHNEFKQGWDALQSEFSVESWASKPQRLAAPLDLASSATFKQRATVAFNIIGKVLCVIAGLAGIAFQAADMGLAAAGLAMTPTISLGLAVATLLVGLVITYRYYQLCYTPTLTAMRKPQQVLQQQQDKLYYEAKTDMGRSKRHPKSTMQFFCERPSELQQHQQANDHDQGRVNSFKVGLRKSV